jgi:hypothetical protein
MKRYSSLIHIVSLACACLIHAGCASQPGAGAATAPSPNSGHLLIYRVPNFGTFVNLIVSVDGKEAGTFTEGQNYDAYLSAGQHQVTLRIDPNRAGIAPLQKTLTIQAGQTYAYTAAWAGDKLALVKNQ